MSQFSFNTIKKPIADVLLKEKGSKFISFASSVSSEEDFKEFLGDIKRKHPKATHHCYAFRIGIDGENYRANDDGEPNGSAGLPIYNQILGKEITNVAVIVVRYYGGTKLGVSGLVKAYKSCAEESLNLAEITTEELTTFISINFKFSVQNVIFSLINKFDGKILEFISAENCIIKAEIKSATFDQFHNKLIEIYEVDFTILEN